MRTLHCFAKGGDGGWEAICVDFDLAVEAPTFDDAKRCLDQAVSSYVEDAQRERPEDARRLLDRRSPWWVRFRLVAEFALHSLRSTDDGRQLAGYDLRCPA